MTDKLKRMYKRIDQNISPLYKMGRDFEYRVMGLLNKHGWHTNRRFGSIGIVFCSKCGFGVSRKTMKCGRCGIKGLKVSLDLTAYKNGTYLMISCKSHKNKASTYLDDQYWENLVLYALRYGAVPLFAGHTETHEIYFVDLRKKVNWDAFYRHPADPTKPKETEIEKLKKESWDVIKIANRKIKGAKSESERTKWIEAKIKMINVLNRLLWRAGSTTTSTDLTELLATAPPPEPQVETEKKEERKVVPKRKK